MGLVAHLFAVFDPVAQVNRFQLQPLGFGDLPENGEAPQAATLFGGFVEGVDRRQAVGQQVGHGNRQKLAVEAEFVEA
ncbi:hypothetical protein D3C76_1782840 [compost metagenome]